MIIKALMLYLAAGLVVIVLTRARQKVLAALLDRNLQRIPGWKRFAFRFMVFSGALLLWPVFAPGWFRKEKTVLQRLQENPICRQQKAAHDLMSAMCEGGCEADEIPGGRGEFGLDPTNPVPTHTIHGSRSYLSRLRTSDGARVRYRRKGSLHSEASPHPIDAYVLTNASGDNLAVVYVSPYQKKNSGKAPKGFVLAGEVGPGSTPAA